MIIVAVIQQVETQLFGVIHFCKVTSWHQKWEHRNAVPSKFSISEQELFRKFQIVMLDEHV